MAEMELAMVLHLLGAFLLFSGVVLAGVAFEAARRRELPAEIALLLGLARLSLPFVAIGALLAAVFGFWLVHLIHFSYSEGWVNVSIVLFLAMLAIGGFAGRTPRRARLLATQLAAEGAPMSAELRALLDDLVSRLANYVAFALLIAIVVVMVVK